MGTAREVMPRCRSGRCCCFNQKRSAEIGSNLSHVNNSFELPPLVRFPLGGDLPNQFTSASCKQVF